MYQSNSYRIGNYKISHYHLNSDEIVVVFAGAGLDFPGEPVEEFKNTLMKFGVSITFVIDIYPSWYNSFETNQMFDLIAKIADQYQRVVSIGSSMGGSGCLAFAHYYRRASRILSFAPQYSINRHFIQFDSRFTGVANLYLKQNFPTFAPEAAKQKAVILFGDQDWRDTVHAGMYLAEQFQVVFVRGVDHGVASYLKNAEGENFLHPLIKNFLDFSVEFDRTSVIQAIGRVYAREFIDYAFGIWSLNELPLSKQDELSRHLNDVQLPPPAHLDDLTINSRTNQSSVCQWSWNDTTEEDSANAILKDFSKAYAFHTDFEMNPWWSIIFCIPAHLQEIRIYNRVDDSGCSGRGAFFKLERFNDEAGTWDEFYRRDHGEIFGIEDGKPFIWKSAKAVPASGFRISLLSSGILHYQKVEVFGKFKVL